MHITLAFLGATPADRLDDVVAAAAAAASGARSFSFTLDRLGRFPPDGPPHTIWAGPSAGAEPLARLARSVRAELRARDIAFDDKPFQPHVTIARVAERQAPAEARIVAAAVVSARVRMPPLPGGEVAVIQSILSPRGAR